MILWNRDSCRYGDEKLKFGSIKSAMLKNWCDMSTRMSTMVVKNRERLNHPGRYFYIILSESSQRFPQSSRTSRIAFKVASELFLMFGTTSTRQWLSFLAKTEIDCTSGHHHSRKASFCLCPNSNSKLFFEHFKVFWKYEARSKLLFKLIGSLRLIIESYPQRP